MIDCKYLVPPGKKFNLAKFPTNENGSFKDRSEADALTEQNRRRLIELQEVLYAEAKHAVLVVFQAMDAGGKDGAIEFIFSGVNPQGCKVASFKAPSRNELAHDYLWRIHYQVPPKGMIGIFNRSHYESVLVERVRNLVPDHVWKRRYGHINEFERLLADEGTTIMKFFLHISKDEQKERFEARLKDPHKNWKFNAVDLEERKLWDDYQRAYDDALERCSTEHAPWYIVPSDRKWFRNWVISDVIVRTMEKLDMKFPPAQEGLDKIKVV